MSIMSQLQTVMRQVHNYKLSGGSLMSRRSISRWSKIARSNVWQSNVPQTYDGGQVSCFSYRCPHSIARRRVSEAL